MIKSVNTSSEMATIRLLIKLIYFTSVYTHHKLATEWWLIFEVNENESKNNNH